MTQGIPPHHQATGNWQTGINLDFLIQNVFCYLPLWITFISLSCTERKAWDSCPLRKLPFQGVYPGKFFLPHNFVDRMQNYSLPLDIRKFGAPQITYMFTKCNPLSERPSV